MKLDFTKLVIEYDPETQGDKILELLDSVDVVNFQVSIESPSESGYFCIGGTSPSTLTSAISSIIEHKKDKKVEQ